MILVVRNFSCNRLFYTSHTDWPLTLVCDSQFLCLFRFFVVVVLFRMSKFCVIFSGNSSACPDHRTVVKKKKKFNYPYKWINMKPTQKMKINKFIFLLLLLYFGSRALYTKYFDTMTTTTMSTTTTMMMVEKSSPALSW